MLALPAFAAEERTLIVVQDATWPPMEFVDSDKNIVGYSVDYLDAVAKEAGFKFIHKNMEWEGIFAELAAGKCDVLASSITITEDRKKSMDFSTPYAEVKQAVIVRKDSSIFNEADLQGKTIGAQISTTGFFAAEKIPKSTSKSYDILGLAIEDLANGRIDAVICDNPVAADYALKKEEYAKALKIACIIKDADIEEYGFAVRKGDTATLELLNKGIAAVKEKGIETELMNKWFGE
jgi:polar amino acid transport system substrate-binding protein